MTIRIVALLLSTLFVSLSGCSSTQLVTSWSDASFSEKPVRKIFLVAVTENEMQRNLYEDIFAEQLRKINIDSIAAHTVISSANGRYEEDAIRDGIKATSADAALIARLTDINQQQRYVPPTYSYTPTFGYRRGFYDYYSRSHRVMVSPGYATTDTIVTLETTVFSTSTEKMIWAGSTRSFNPSSAQKLIKENAELIIKDMKASSLL